LGDFRTRNPRFNSKNVNHNLALVDRLQDVAASLGVSVAQAAIAWVGAQGDDIVPLIGARTRQRLAESLGAVDIQFTADQLAAIEDAVPKGAAAGDRYDATQMAMLDSEHPDV
jgi:aryl-alcohol dehydrogenase-like predicted oxidoreductase